MYLISEHILNSSLYYFVVSRFVRCFCGIFISCTLIDCSWTWRKKLGLVSGTFQFRYVLAEDAAHNLNLCHVFVMFYCAFLFFSVCVCAWLKILGFCVVFLCLIHNTLICMYMYHNFEAVLLIDCVCQMNVFCEGRIEDSKPGVCVFSVAFNQIAFVNGMCFMKEGLKLASLASVFFSCI